MHLFVTEMCTYVQISATKWCIVGYGTGALGFMQQVYSRVELRSNFGVTKYSPQVINDVRFQYWFTEKLESSWSQLGRLCWNTVYPKKYAHGFVVLCFVVVMQSFIINSHEVFIHIHQGCFAGTGAIVRLPQCQWSKPGGYGKISQCITTTKHSKAKTVCIFLGVYCNVMS